MSGPVPERASPRVRALDVDGVGAVAIGTALWAIAAVVLMLRRDALATQDRGEWVWIAIAGVGLGLLGLVYVRRRRTAYRTAQPVTAPTDD